jgi:hypothetical protein
MVAPQVTGVAFGFLSFAADATGNIPSTPASRIVERRVFKMFYLLLIAANRVVSYEMPALS